MVPTVSVDEETQLLDLSGEILDLLLLLRLTQYTGRMNRTANRKSHQ